MMLRGKLLLAQLPLAAALVVVGYVSLRTTRALGSSSDAILRDNYRSVLAAQRMKESLERIDSAAAFMVMGEREQALRQVEENRPRFESELRAQEANITEPAEAETTRALRADWQSYLQLIDRFNALTDPAQEKSLYFGELQPEFVQVKTRADQVLALNQDAMVRKSDLAQRQAARVNTLLVLVTLLALLAGGLASSALTARLLRPLSVLTQAARRIGEGDLDARAKVPGTDEVSQLAHEFNEMAEHLRKYRETTLGELLQVQGGAQAAIDSLPDAVVVFDAEGNVLNVNRVAERDLHVEIESGEAALARVEPELRATFERLRAHVLAGKGAYQPKGFEESLRISGPEGDRYLLPRATPVHAEGGGVSGATVVLQDVTKLRRFDELKNDLVATVAHEFRTPLTSLRMAIHLCLEGAAGPLTEKEIDLLQAGREDCERLQGIVDDLLDLSRLQSGRVELHRREVAVQSLIDEAAELTRAQSAGRHIFVEASDLTGGARLRIDPDRMDLVFANLVNNAIRYSPEGGVIAIQARSNDGAVRFEILDQGPGIPEEHRARIFEKFFRVPGLSGGGAGLGLYICKEIVLAHGGEIGVDARPEGGSNFWFTVPLAAAHERPAGSPSAPS